MVRDDLEKLSLEKPFIDWINSTTGSAANIRDTLIIILSNVPARILSVMATKEMRRRSE